MTKVAAMQLGDARVLVEVGASGVRKELRMWRIEGNRAKLVQERQLSHAALVIESAVVGKTEVLVVVTEAGEWILLDSTGSPQLQGSIRLQGEKQPPASVSYATNTVWCLIAAFCSNAIHQFLLTVDRKGGFHLKTIAYRVTETHWPVALITHLAVVRGNTVDYAV